MLVVAAGERLRRFVADAVRGGPWRVEIAAPPYPPPDRRDDLGAVVLGFTAGVDDDGPEVAWVLHHVAERASEGRGLPLVVVGSLPAGARGSLSLRRAAAVQVGEPYTSEVVRQAVATALGRTAVGERMLAVSAGEVDIDRGLAIRTDRVERLTNKERALLSYLACRPRQVVPAEELLEAVWGYAPRTSTNTLATHLRSLRLKIEADPQRPRNLITVRRRGLWFEPTAGDREGSAGVEASDVPDLPPPRHDVRGDVIQSGGGR